MTIIICLSAIVMANDDAHWTCYVYIHMFTKLIVESLQSLVCRLRDHLLESLGCEGLWSLYWETESSVPDQRRQNSESSGHSKQHSVETHFVHPVVLGIER